MSQVTDPDLPLPAGYPELLEDLKRTVAGARWHAQRAVNTELLRLYWRLGRAILSRQQAEGWGTRVIDRLAADLRAAFPEMRGLSQRNLVYMRTFAAAFRGEITQQPVARLPWGHVTVLLDRLDDQAQREWYAAAAVQHGWSRNVLLHQIMNRLHQRAGAAPSNFPDQLPAKDSELAQQLTRDPYVLDFLDLTGPAAERDLETALVNRLQAFLLELGHGFAFVGRQYRFSVGGDDFAIDLLFFNWAQSRFVVVELKIGRFEPEYVGKLGFYVSWVDETAATTRSCATPSPAPAHRSPSRATPTTPFRSQPVPLCPPTSSSPAPPEPSSTSSPHPGPSHPAAASSRVPRPERTASHNRRIGKPTRQ
jgi:predicted nuclease of restriction endonuclease-like (RecB) superfamily